MKRINHALRYRDVCRWLVLALALGGVQVANAQSTDRITAAEFGRLWGPALDPSGATQVRNYPVGPAYTVTAAPAVTAEAGGGLAVTKSARFPVDASRVIDVTAKAAITKAAMGKALKGAVALTGGPLGVALFAASEIVDWMNQSGLRQSPTSPGVIERQATGSCTVAPCYNYTLQGQGGTGDYPYRTSLEAACADTLASKTRRFPTYVFIYVSVNYVSNICNYTLQTSPGATPSAQFDPYDRVTRSPDSSATYQVATPSEIETASSAPAMKPEWLRRVLDSGVPVDSSNPTLTGPATASGPSSTSTTQIKDASGNVTGTQTVTNSTTYNITYNGNTYNVNSVTTTTTVNPDGTSSVQTDTASKPTEKDPATDCDKYPSSLGCSDLDVPTGDIPKTTKNIVYTSETWFGGGSCPADKYLTTHGLQIKVWDWQSTCSNLVIYFRPVLLIVAGVMAMFIALPKGAGT